MHLRVPQFLRLLQFLWLLQFLQFLRLLSENGGAVPVDSAALLC